MTTAVQKLKVFEPEEDDVAADFSDVSDRNEDPSRPVTLDAAIGLAEGATRILDSEGQYPVAQKIQEAIETARGIELLLLMYPDGFGSQAVNRILKTVVTELMELVQTEEGALASSTLD